MVRRRERAVSNHEVNIGLILRDTACAVPQDEESERPTTEYGSVAFPKATPCKAHSRAAVDISAANGHRWPSCL